ncbi:HlyD family secretion protein [Microbacterium sp. W1N]|uniref:HlyD family secretion protein n=1 Tax=Microbacterium festucae TaxID=2977531 RepID=UPI0021C184D5|nr:HlyD family secretion protein [Microbacterium festucae]MCT9820607.1 HlyD family secretion protein [Microbacterium festucae]
MTWRSRMRLFVGLVATLAVVAACTLLFTQRQNSVRSDSAAIVAQEYPVGTDYGGIVTAQFAHEGDAVTAGEVLFEVHSPQLQRDVALGVVAGGADAAAGTTAVTASVDGILADIRVPQGGFAQAGSELATISRDASLSVEGEFVLTPRDYARITAGTTAEIELPNRSVLTGRVTTIDVATVDGQAAATVALDSDALAVATADWLFQPGTPVAVTLRLRDEGPFAGVHEAIADLLGKIGL